MKLTRQDYAFNNSKIAYLYPKGHELDRVLINLYILLKHNGRRPVRKKAAREVTLEAILDGLLRHHADTLDGFTEHRELITDWAYSDLIDVVSRGNPDKEKVAAPRPLHLNAYKLRNDKQVRTSDSGASEQLYSMLTTVDDDLVDRLKRFLGQGTRAPNFDNYDETTPLDLDTLLIVRMVDNDDLTDRPSPDRERLDPPLCRGQARLLADDLRRLLAYEAHVPRAVLIDYLRTLIGLHLGLYLLRLFHQLPGWVARSGGHPTCLDCPVRPGEQARPFQPCPYAAQNPDPDPAALPELLIDMGDNYNSHMARLARQNCARHYAAITDYVHDVLAVNQLFRFANTSRGQTYIRARDLPESNTVAGVLTLLDDPGDRFHDFFADLQDNLFDGEIEADETERHEVKGIRAMHSLSSFESFVELIALERTKYYRSHLIFQLDSLFMKNAPTGLMAQGKSTRNQRRWRMGSRLLEVLVQLAVLEPAADAPEGFRSRPILIDGFVAWLRERYGFALAPNWPEATIHDLAAFNDNLRELKRRLREIGFYVDLSDAYNAQQIRPRYSIAPANEATVA